LTFETEFSGVIKEALISDSWDSKVMSPFLVFAIAMPILYPYTSMVNAFLRGCCSQLNFDLQPAKDGQNCMDFSTFLPHVRLP
jgi:hypothetical protein